jgi:hypothetical protein
MNYSFQDMWATKFPCIESILGKDGKVMQMRCKVDTLIERRKKLLVSKL